MSQAINVNKVIRIDLLSQRRAEVWPEVSVEKERLSCVWCLVMRGARGSSL